MTLKEFSVIFSNRHDFIYDDYYYLKDKYNIDFVNIPEAWVCVIDDYFIRLDDITKISKVEQIFGHVIITASIQSNHDKNIIEKLSKRIINIDRDIHESLDKCMGIN